MRVLGPGAALLVVIGLGGACSSSSTTLLGPAVIKCAATASTPIAPVTAAGGVSSLTVNALPECGWTAATEASWVTELAPTAGQGQGQIQFTVAPNPTASARQADILLNDVPVRLTQPGTSCSFTVTPRAREVASTGGVINLVVTTGEGCGWTVSTNASWMTVSGEASRSGSGDLELEVAGNTGPSRTASASVAGQTVTVNQRAATGAPSATSCAYAIAPTSHQAGPGGGADRTTVTAPPGCAWTASSHASWISVIGATSGTGSGPLQFVVDPNTGPGRTGTITVADQVLTVTQGGDCSFAIDPGGQSFGAEGGTGSPVAVTTGSGCGWAATPSDAWITITSGAGGTGSGTVGFRVDANSSVARTGTMTIAGQTFTVSQASGCVFAVAPTSFDRDKSPVTDLTVTVTAGAGCLWTAVSNDAWIEVTAGASGAGSGAVLFSLERNRGNGRTGSLTVAGTTVTVVQN